MNLKDSLAGSHNFHLPLCILTEMRSVARGSGRLRVEIVISVACLERCQLLFTLAASRWLCPVSISRHTLYYAGQVQPLLTNGSLPCWLRLTRSELFASLLKRGSLIASNSYCFAKSISRFLLLLPPRCLSHPTRLSGLEASGKADFKVAPEPFAIKL
jgi:hypothetical protein